ncbi:Uncharacterised protein [Mycobacteroides abscessus subsp. abscessus]|nr:Uncharacterised protein [Mycobacteroides abscessus subsp. abscessus]
MGVIFDKAKVDTVFASGGEQWRKPHTQTVFTDDAGNCLDHLAQEPEAILQGTAVFVVAVVGMGGHELVDQVPVG